MTQKYLDQLTYDIIGCAIEVQKEMGPGLLESIYEACLTEELQVKGFSYTSQMPVPVVYKGKLLNVELRLDILVEDVMIIELKSTESILPIHQAQLLTYMKLIQKPKGIIINFNSTNIFKEGQKTLVNDYYRQLPRE